MQLHKTKDDNKLKLRCLRELAHYFQYSFNQLSIFCLLSLILRELDVKQILIMSFKKKHVSWWLFKLCPQINRLGLSLWESQVSHTHSQPRD